jgi:hypothetical protein
MLPGDELVDLFPGTGIVSRAWAELGRLPSPGARADASQGYRGDTFADGISDAGHWADGTASQEYSDDGPVAS